jgi:threonine aldolase
MLDAMYRAEIGDDLYREDPSVHKLEELSAQLLGKEAGLFCPSGVMGNQVAVYTHTQRGDEIIAESNAHVATSERGAPALISSVMVRTSETEKGVLDPIKVRSLIRPKGALPRTSLLCIENTHNKAGGTVTPLARMRELCQLAKENELAIHVDGARVFNAALALGVEPKELVKQADSVMFSLAKALSAPAGSMLVGSKDFIHKAWETRYLFGGQMHMMGHLAAAGIVALTTMRDRLGEDHRRARLLGEGLKNIDGISIDLDRVQTNIVIFDISPLGIGAKKFLQELLADGIKAFAFSDSIIRMVPHRHTSDEDIDRALASVQRIARKHRRA